MAGTRPRPRHTGGLEGEAARGRGGGQEGGTRSRQSGGKSGVLPARRFRQRFPCGGHRVGSISGAKWPVHSPPGSILCSSIGCVCCLSRRGWGLTFVAVWSCPSRASGAQPSFKTAIPKGRSNTLLRGKKGTWTHIRNHAVEISIKCLAFF